MNHIKKYFKEVSSKECENVLPDSYKLLMEGHLSSLLYKKVLISEESIAKIMPSQEEVLVKIDEIIKDNKIAMFSKSYCPYCKKAKAIFDELSEKYFMLELDELGEEICAVYQDALMSKSGQRTVPNVFINGKHLGGHSDTSDALKSGELVKMLGK